MTNDKRISTMKLRFNYYKIAGLCRIHNIVGSSKDNQGKYIWMRIMKGKIIWAGQDNASSMEGALFFMLWRRGKCTHLCGAFDDR